MGTNYYLHSNICPYCGRSDRRHIGKSSAGWVFALRIYPEERIGMLSDWVALWSGPGTQIRDEYGGLITPDNLHAIITERDWPNYPIQRPPEWYTANHAEPGPGGLARATIDGNHCVGHGSGTWDYHVGEFS